MAHVHTVYGITGTATGSSGNISGQARWILIHSDVSGYYTLDGTTTPGSTVGMVLSTSPDVAPIPVDHPHEINFVSGSTSTGLIRILEII